MDSRLLYVGRASKGSASRTTCSAGCDGMARGRRARHFSRVLPTITRPNQRMFGKGGARGEAGELDWALKPGLP